MYLDTYQQLVKDTAWAYEHRPFRDQLFTAVTELGEVGEVLDILKKEIARKPDVQTQTDLTAEVLIRLEDEIGDAIWALTQLANVLELKLSSIVRGNADKVEERLTRRVNLTNRENSDTL